jgi:hypothetical protein
LVSQKKRKQSRDAETAVLVETLRMRMTNQEALEKKRIQEEEEEGRVQRSNFREERNASTMNSKAGQPKSRKNAGPTEGGPESGAPGNMHTNA